MIRAACLAAVLAVSAAVPALAQPLPQGGPSHQEIADWLRREGLDAEVRSEGEETWVASGANGVSWDMNGYDCAEGRCAAWQFSAAFLVDGLGPDTVNRWNTERRYLKAFSAPHPEGAAVIVQHDILVTPGLDWAAMTEHLRLFAGTVPAFAEHIGYVASAPAE